MKFFFFLFFLNTTVKSFDFFLKMKKGKKINGVNGIKINSDQLAPINKASFELGFKHYTEYM